MLRHCHRCKSEDRPCNCCEFKWT